VPKRTKKGNDEPDSRKKGCRGGDENIGREDYLLFRSNTTSKYGWSHHTAKVKGCRSGATEATNPQLIFLEEREGVRIRLKPRNERRKIDQRREGTVF